VETSALDVARRERNMSLPCLERRSSSMCHEWYERRRRDAEESREMWRDFERTRLVRDPEPVDETDDGEPTEVREAVVSPER
jgi:hypothetical protein